MAELKAKTAPEEVKRTVIAFLRAARCLNETIPPSRHYLDLDAAGLDEPKVEKTLDTAWEVFSELQSLQESTALPGPLRDLFGITLKNRVKRDLFQATADALFSDLSAAIAGYLSRDWFKLTQGPIPGAKRLLFVIDDYEALGPLLGDFLVGALVPRLADASFPTLLVISGRDDLEVTHTGWSQHCKRYLQERIRLQPFDRAVALELLRQGEIPDSRVDEIYTATQGLPFLLSLAIEEARDEDAGSALFLKRFYERTTRWMSQRQRDWFVSTCYLDVINEDTLARLYLPSEALEIQDWFEIEASIRDPTHNVFRVRPLIRD